MKKKHFKTGGYSREFTPRGSGRRYLLDRIPVPLWLRVRAKAKATKVSVRAVTLRLLSQWVED